MSVVLLIPFCLIHALGILHPDLFSCMSPFRNRFAKIYDIHHILVVALLGLNEQIYLRVVRRLL